MDARARRPGAGEGELRVQIPPGWLPLTGAQTDTEAFAAFDRALTPFQDQLTPRTRARLNVAFRDGRRLAKGAGFHLAGLLPTVWMQKIPTVWFYGIRVLRGAGGGELDPVALVERALRVGLATGAAEPVTFYAVDGRIGSSLTTTLPRTGLPDVEVDAEMAMPLRKQRGRTSDALGAVVAVLPLPGRPDDLLLLFGSAPEEEQRAAMAIYASILVHSAHVVGGALSSLRTIDLDLREAFGPGQRQNDDEGDDVEDDPDD